MENGAMEKVGCGALRSEGSTRCTPSSESQPMKKS